MKSIFVFLILVASIEAQLKDCPPEQKHSGAYDELISDIGAYVQFNTWTNTCQDMTVDYQRNYMALLNARGVKCKGKLCVNDQFLCRPGDSKCYGINHVILLGDLNQYCNINLAVNLIMSWKYWNIMLEAELCMRDIISEKLEVFGSNIYCSVINQLKKCNDPRCNIEIPPLCLPPRPEMSPGSVAALVILMIALAIFGGSICYIKRYRIMEIISNYRRI